MTDLARYARCYAQVDLGAVSANVRKLKAQTKRHTHMIAVVKADAYGHGALMVARRLKEDVSAFAVATAEEAFELRDGGIELPILVLGVTFPYSYERMIVQGIRPTVFTMEAARKLSEKASALGKKVCVHVKVDTGMGRIGILPNEQGLFFVRELSQLPGVVVEGIYTHFARADERDKSHTNKQLLEFTAFTDRIASKLSLTGLIRHCSNSAGILELRQGDLDGVRAGIAMYGLPPSKQVNGDAVELEPALSLYSTIVHVKWLPEGSPVSYGGTYVTESPTRIATVPIGYGDGYPGSLSGKGYVLIKGKPAPIVGRICMDQFMVDVTGIEDVNVGERVTLIGRDGAEEITAFLLGELSGRFHYELLCDLGKRVPRVYIG